MGDDVVWQMHVTEYEVTRAVIKQHPATHTLLERIKEAEQVGLQAKETTVDSLLR